MAEASYPQHPVHDDDDDECFDQHEVLMSSFSSHTNWCHDLDDFEVYPSDLVFPSSDDFFCHTDRNPTQISPNDNDSGMLDRENRVNFVIDMLHQRVEQSQSASRVVVENDLGDSDRSFRLIEENEGMDSNDLEVDFGLGLELAFPAEFNNDCNDGDDNLGFIVADCGDDFFVSRRARDGTDRSVSGDPSSRSVGQEYLMGGFRVSDLGSESDVTGESEVYFGMDMGCDDESNLALFWEAFRLEDNNDRGDSNANANEDFEWEEVDGLIDDREVLNMILEAEANDDASVLPGIPPDAQELGERQPEALEWEVLLNAQNLEANPDVAAGQYDEYNYTDNEMLFGQFADNDASSSGWPPASRRVVENLLSVIITQEDIEKNNTHCVVCKDEIEVGLVAKQLPCDHRYHGDCIVPWLGIRNTCPVCRHELPTDDPDYERRKTERTARNH